MNFEKIMLAGGPELSEGDIDQRDPLDKPICPKCGDGMLEFDGKNREEDGHYYHFHCTKCGEEFSNRGYARWPE